MIEDPIVQDVRRHRQAHAAQYGHDLARIVQALRRRERESDRLLLNPGPNILNPGATRGRDTDPHFT